MLKKLKEIFGFPTEQEKAAAKEEVKAQATPTVSADNVFPFPTSDKPEVEVKPKAEPAKPKAKRTPKPKAEGAAKPAAKKPAAKKAAPKKEAVVEAKPKRTRKTKAV